jgi:hypothetical protein
VLFAARRIPIPARFAATGLEVQANTRQAASVYSARPLVNLSYVDCVVNVGTAGLPAMMTEANDIRRTVFQFDAGVLQIRFHQLMRIDNDDI